MSPRLKRPARMAWNSACQSCAAFVQWLYSLLVLLLACVTAFTAYVATLEDIPVPNFIIRELRDHLKAQGLSLRMEGVRLHPSGRVIFDGFELYSPEFGSTVFSAKQASAKLKLMHLLAGSLAIDSVSLSSGRFDLPAMITPSGETMPALESINLEATHRGQRWVIGFATASVGELKVLLSGSIEDKHFIAKPDDGSGPGPSPSQRILQVAPKLLQLQKELKRFEHPFCIIDLEVLNRRQTGFVKLGASSAKISPELSLESVLLLADVDLDHRIELELSAQNARHAKGVSLDLVKLAARWPEFPSPEAFLPESIQLAATGLHFRNAQLPSLTASLIPGASEHRATLQFSVPEEAIEIKLRHDPDSGKTSAELQATLDEATVDALEPLALEFAKKSLRDSSDVPTALSAHAKVELDASFKPVSATAYAQSGPVSLLGASIDYAAVSASLNGPQIEVPDIRLISGQQSGSITIYYNLDTLLRRILVEGRFDPTMINGWFKPWWSAMWDGMVFPESGMLTYLDSQATFKRPDTVVVTGSGFTEDLDLRGMPVSGFRTRLYSLFRYVDLYEMEIETEDGQQAVGEIQFHMDRDLRDEKDKLTGIWIDAVSTLDVKKAPSLLWEIAKETAEILEPYCYDLPPFIEAHSSSVRHLDEFINHIELDIQSAGPFSYYGFPFDDLEVDVRIDDDLVDIPLAQASLGRGSLEANAFIVGDAIDLDARLSDANFGETLNASNTYFANDGSETAQTMDTDRLLAFGGTLNASFTGRGIAGDSLSYRGSGRFDIEGADFGKFQMFGLLSMALEITPLRFTTLKFTDASAPFTVDRKLVHFIDGTIEGPVALINTAGSYNIESDALNFTAKLFPFRNSRVPLISPLINLPLNIVSNVFEVSVTGTFDAPELRLFNPSTKEEIDVSADDRPKRDSRPKRR